MISNSYFMAGLALFWQDVTRIASVIGPDQITCKLFDM